MMLGFKINNHRRHDFQDLILEHMNALYNFAWRLTGNKEQAEDLVQEAALRGFKHFGKYESGTNFKAWMMTILRNIFINQYRKTTREPNKVSYEVIEDFVSLPDPRSAEEEIFGEHVQGALDQLPEELRTVVNLFYVEGLSYKEIAGVMQCPIGTVMSRLHMARQTLKARLAGFAEKGELL